MARPLNRRTFLTASALGAAGLCGAYRLVPPSRSQPLASVDTLSQRLYLSLDETQRAETCVSYAHPLRQYHNRGVWGGGRSVFLGFDRWQRQLITDLLHAGLSDEGRQRIPNEYFTKWPGVHSMRVLICGDPTSGPYQVILTSAHMNLRLGGKSGEGAAFGGPQVYGDQRGNGEPGLPGNLYRDQFLLGQRLYQGLDDGRKKLALLPEAPVQTAIELQGRRGSFPGLPVAELADDGKALVRQLVARILSTYAGADAAYAHECLAANGGIEALSLSYYRTGDEGAIPEAQVFRLEGPGAVFYYRGHPHLHAFLNLAMDGDAPLSVGEPLGNNPQWLDRAGVKALFEAALRSQMAAPLGYYPETSVAGRLRAGAIRSGDIYTLESWQEHAALVEIRGSDLSPALRASLSERNLELVPGALYKVATTAYAASSLEKELGKIHSRVAAPLVRDLTLAHVRASGFSKV